MLDSGMPRASARPLRMRCGDWVDAQTMSMPSTGSSMAITPRGSIGEDEQRAWRNVSARRMSAAARARATSPFSKRVRKSALSGSSSWTRGAPGASADWASATTGSGS